MPSIHIRAVEKSYATGGGRVKALRGVDLEIDEPGFYGIMGPSGSGKSTLLHLLAALDRPDRGTIEVAGYRIERMSERDLTLFRRQRIGIIFQQFNLIGTLTALDNVALPAMLAGVPKTEREERAMELLGRLGLLDRASHRPDALSGGEQQRVAIARALYYEPPILFADEPTGNLDSTTSANLWRQLRELAEERSMTVLMVTHEPSAAAHCRRIHVLRDGRIELFFDVKGDDAIASALRAQQPVG